MTQVIYELFEIDHFLSKTTGFLLVHAVEITDYKLFIFYSANSPIQNWLSMVALHKTIDIDK